jgi:hypothetical protein
MNQAVFHILAYQRGKDVFESNGSAFFIDGQATFISAGHNFKSPINEYKAYINGAYYEINKLYHEYEDHDDQQPPIYKDLFIGQITGFVPKHYYALSSAADLTSKDLLVAIGYSTLNVKEAGNLDDLYGADFYGDEDVEESDALNKIMTRHYGEMPVAFGGQQFLHIHKYRDERPVFENGFTISVPIAEPHGYSGGPVIQKNNAVGMLIGENGAISSDHIIEKLKHLQTSEIESEIKSQMAVPYSADNSWLCEGAEQVHLKLKGTDQIYADHYRDIYYVSKAEVDQLPRPMEVSVLNGLGGVQSNYWLNDRNVHLVVINPAACEQASLSRSEIQSAIAHELGHIFNDNPKMQRPSILTASQSGTPFSKDDDNRIRKENLLNMELYADKYAKKNGWGASLIRCIKKYIRSNPCADISMFNTRLEKLERW